MRASGSAYSDQNGGMASYHAGEQTDRAMLESCMNAKGYSLRNITGGEIAISIVTSPIYAASFLLLKTPVDFY